MFGCDYDNRLKAATNQAIQSGVLTPLIKEELWSKIQHRRLSNGLGELTVSFDKEKTLPLRPEERLKADKRKLLNRAAAAKCRRRKKEKSENLKKTLEELEKTKILLVDQVNWLESQIEWYQEGLRKMGLVPPNCSTSPVCARPPPPPYQIHTAACITSTPQIDIPSSSTSCVTIIPCNSSPSSSDTASSVTSAYQRGSPSSNHTASSVTSAYQRGSPSSNHTASSLTSAYQRGSPSSNYTASSVTSAYQRGSPSSNHTASSVTSAHQRGSPSSPIPCFAHTPQRTIPSPSYAAYIPILEGIYNDSTDVSTETESDISFLPLLDKIPPVNTSDDIMMETDQADHEVPL